MIAERRAEDPRLSYLTARVEDLAAQHKLIVHEVQLNTALTQQIATSTAGLVDAWGALAGGIKVMCVAGRVAKWLAGVGGAIAALWYLFIHGVPPT